MDSFECDAMSMEKEASPPSDPNSTTTTVSTSSPPASILAPHSPPSVHTDDAQKKQQFSTNFTALYRSIFPPKFSSPSDTTTSSPPPRSSASSSDLNQYASGKSSATKSDADHRLEQARLVVDYENLCDRYSICRSELQDLTNEISALRRENASLRVTNKELAKLLSLSVSSQSTMHDCFRRLNLVESGSDFSGDEQSTYSPTSVVEQSRFERTDPERVWLPKSISVRSSSYLKANQSATNSGSSSRTASQLRAATELEGKQRMYLPGAKKELEVYSQGMFKTELCNKWQETGACPYGDHCQFAHGIAELRPVIRHPRYKTEVCRMVLAGDNCPYGHRCHFRHSLTEQEMMLAGASPR
ncbi:zinc finger CCCH domain-containing protein 14-like isoform X2 [Punica granatum]|uniref:Zinc finger CCCH domain-containing protein 14-like isoform X2 n=1 Tax=Punica granatum TaxID=22663 RepID=A0A6P8C6K7_PUNGR|nr:zinc finger CCCH domain-containing protein 14-like isoform X2 [Punica granatum]